MSHLRTLCLSGWSSSCPASEPDVKLECNISRSGGPDRWASDTLLQSGSWEPSTCCTTVSMPGRWAHPGKGVGRPHPMEVIGCITSDHLSVTRLWSALIWWPGASVVTGLADTPHGHWLTRPLSPPGKGVGVGSARRPWPQSGHGNMGPMYWRA